MNLLLKYICSKRGVLLTSILITSICSLMLISQPRTENKELIQIQSALETFEFMNLQRNGLLPPRTEPTPVMPITQWCYFDPRSPENYLNSGGWQEVTRCKRETFLFTAYYDVRSTTRFKNYKAIVRILAMVEKGVVEPYYCQVWSDKSLLIIVQAEAEEIWERAWDPRHDFYTSVLFSCPLPTAVVPTHISLTVRPCSSASNFLPVTYKLPSPAANDSATNIVVCVKGMDFTDDLSVRLIEWLEATLMFGASKVAIYTYAVHPNVSEVLKLYEHSGQLEQIKLTLPGRMPNIPLIRTNYIQRNRQQKRRNELIPYNDCLYRHLYTHQFLLIIDIDELIVPLSQHSTYDKLLKHLIGENLEDRGWTALSVSNAFFFANLSQGKADPIKELPRDIAKNMYMLSHPYRSKAISPPGSYGKSFMYIPNLVTVFNHFPLRKIRPGLRKTVFVDVKFAIKQHYKSTCPIESRDECPRLYRDSVKDTSLLEHRDRLLPKVKSVLKNLKWIS